jgi:hypothetical protein
MRKLTAFWLAVLTGVLVLLLSLAFALVQSPARQAGWSVEMSACRELLPEEAPAAVRRCRISR